MECIEICGGRVGVKTYLTLILYSEGANPIEIVERLRSLGFEPVTGVHDHVYDWGRRRVELEDILQIASSVHETLKGLKVFYRLETK